MDLQEILQDQGNAGHLSVSDRAWKAEQLRTPITVDYNETDRLVKDKP
jgi:hypothetical protein